MNTVAGNEALVHHWASLPHYQGLGLGFYGVNPGLLHTDIRGGKASFTGWVTETLVGLLAPTLEDYAATMLCTFTAPDLSKHSGVMLSQKGEVIKPNRQFEEVGKAEEWYQAMVDLVKRKTGV